MISLLPQDVLLISCDGVRAAEGRMKAQVRHLCSPADVISVYRIQERILKHIKGFNLVPLS